MDKVWTRFPPAGSDGHVFFYMSICCFGVTSNTDASQLAETFVERKCPTKVVGIPVTLNGDLKSQFVETNVGFDTICKFSLEDIHDLQYYYFIRLMGRKASHVALECTLQSHPNRVILAEEVAASKLTLIDINVGTFLQLQLPLQIKMVQAEKMGSRSKPEKVQVYVGKGEQTQRQIHLGGSSQRVDEYVYAELMRQAVGQLQQAAGHCNKTRFSHQIFLVETMLLPS